MSLWKIPHCFCQCLLISYVMNITMLNENKTIIVRDVGEQQHNNLKKDAMNWENGMTDNARRSSPNYFDRKVLFLNFKPPRYSHPTLKWWCCIHFSQMALSMTNKFFFPLKKELHPQSELREYRVTAGLRERTQPKVISLSLAGRTLYTPRKKYILSLFACAYA